jgi:hypothetical protein
MSDKGFLFPELTGSAVSVSPPWVSPPGSPFLLNPNYVPPPLPLAAHWREALVGPSLQAAPASPASETPWYSPPGSPFLLNPNYVPPRLPAGALDRWRELVAGGSPQETSRPLASLPSSYAPPGSPFLINPAYVPPPLPGGVVERWRELIARPSAEQPAPDSLQQTLAHYANAGDNPFVPKWDAWLRTQSPTLPLSSSTPATNLDSIAELVNKASPLGVYKSIESNQLEAILNWAPPAWEQTATLGLKRNKSKAVGMSDISQGVFGSLEYGAPKNLNRLRLGDPKLRLAYIQWLASFYPPNAPVQADFSALYLKEREQWAPSQKWPV